MKFPALFLVFIAICHAQSAPPPDEQQELNRALSEAGASPVDFTRALENHLAKYPKTAKRPEIERALVKAAIEAKDDRRIILYGEHVLDREAGDPQILDRVTRALLASDAKESSERALRYAKRYEEQVASLREQPPAGHFGRAQWLEELERGIARAIVLQARATGNLNKPDEALVLARRSWEEFPTAEGAREVARWLQKTGHERDAVPYLADAFTVADPRNTEADRARDRNAMGDLYRKLNGSEKGLGDMMLESWDRTTAQLATERLKFRESDPNAEATRVMDFTLSSVKGDKLNLTQFRGKTVVFDFWATWCGPCRIQHPLYEEVKKRFAANGDVVFLSVDTDEDRDQVGPFLTEQKWSNEAYFDDGLARVLQISSIPTTIIVDRKGEVASRMNGFMPERFVDMLTDRIEQALKN